MRGMFGALDGSEGFAKGLAGGSITRRNLVGAAGVVGALAVFGSCGALARAKESAQADSVGSAGAEASSAEGASESAATGDAAYAGDTIYIHDVLHCKPGTGKEIYDRYVAEYVPGALERGMTLTHVYVNPPIWLSDDYANNTIEFVWSVAGMMGWAQMVGVSRYSTDVAPALIEFWQGMDKELESRQRFLSGPDGDVDSLTNWSRLGV